MKDECATCMERYRLAGLNLERGLRPAGRLRQKLHRIRDLAQKIARKRGDA